MRPLFLVSALLISGIALGGEPSPLLDEAAALMHEGLERELPAPTVRGPPQWPNAQPPAPAEPPKDQPRKDELQKKDTLGERVRNEASLRARAAAEERRSAPDNNQGVGQTRTKAAKATGPRPKPPRP